MTGYGPQENWTVNEKMPFFKALEEEVIKAKSSEKYIYIQMDGNSKLGPNIIPGDPHAQSENGKILAAIIKRNALIVMNSSNMKCTGKITRKRITKKKTEESIIDFVLVCENMDDMVEGLVIDESKNHALTSYTKTENGTNVKESDHNSMITNIKALWVKKPQIKRVEIYNLKDREGLTKFKFMTSKDTFLSSVFCENGSINIQTKKFLKRLGYCMNTCFKKIRVNSKNRRNIELEELFNHRRILRSKKDNISFKKLKQVEEKLANICAEDNAKIIEDACTDLTCEEGGVNAGKLWKLKKRLKGIAQDPQSAPSARFKGKSCHLKQST